MKPINDRDLLVFFSSLLITSMVFSPFLLSISMMSLIVISLFNVRLGFGIWSLRFNKEGWCRVLNILKHPSFAVLILMFFLVLLRAYPIEDYGYFLSRLRVKMPFLALPIVFLALPRFDTKLVHSLLYFMLTLFTITGIGVLVNYFQYFEQLTEMMRQGHHIPTPRNHIRFSLLLAWTIMCGLYLFEQKFYFKFKAERWWVLGSTIFLFVLIHLLSVKSGLLVLYVGLGTWILRIVFVKRQLKLGLILLLLTVSLPFLAYQLIPSFKNKVNYTKYDINMFLKGEGGEYSDSGRLASLDVGCQIAKEHFWLGAGSGNLKKEVGQKYREKYPDYVEPFMMQNQFLYVLAGTGIGGLLLFIFIFFFPLFYQRNYQHTLFLIFYIMIFVIIMIEHALENAVGVAHYLFFLLILLSWLNRGKSLSKNFS